MKRPIMLAIICIAGIHIRAVAMSSTDYESMYNIAEADAEQRRHEEELARAERMGAYETGYWESKSDFSGQRERRGAEEDRAAREERLGAYSEYYGGLAAQEEAKYEQKLQEFEQMTNQSYEEAKRTVEQEKRAAQALSNILRSAQMQAQFEEQTAQLAHAAEKAAQTAAFLENVIQMGERTAERSSRIEAVKAREQEWERAYQAARESEVALERMIRSAQYQEAFDDAIKRDIERTEQQLEEVRLKIKKKTEALRLEVQFAQASAQFNEEWQRAQEEINKSYAKKAAHQLENLKHTILDFKERIIDPALQQAADSTASAISRVSQAVNQNREWKKEAEQAASKAQAWMTQARAWVSAQVGAMPSLPRGEAAWMSAPGYVPARMRGPSYRDTGVFKPEELAQRASAPQVTQRYRNAVKQFDNRKRQKGKVGYEAFLAYLMNEFEQIKQELQAKPALKRAVTTNVVPLLVRAWKSEDVLLEYINDYLKKLNSELNMFESARMTAGLQSQFQRPPKFAGLVGSGS